MSKAGVTIELPENLPASLRPLRYECVETGNFNHVLIAEDSVPAEGCQDGVVLKVAREHPLHPPELDTRQMLYREAGAVAFLGSEMASIAHESQFPRTLARDPKGRWAAFSRVAGTVLGPKDIASFSLQEYRDWGRETGRVTALLARIDLRAFHEEVDKPYGPALFSRKRQLVESMEHAVELREKGYPQLSEVLIALSKQYHTLLAQGAFGKDQVIHGDLQPDNVSFIRQADSQRLMWGTFDFGAVQGGQAEEDFRFLAFYSHSGVATTAAIEVYETETGRSLRPEIVEFWYRAHVVLGPVHAVLTGRPVNPHAPTYMGQAYPDYDWTELREPMLPRRHA